MRFRSVTQDINQMLHRPQIGQKSASSPAPSTIMVENLLESDRLYFETGSQIKILPEAVVAYMSNLTHIPAGCVVHRIDDSFSTVEEWDKWVTQLEQKLFQLGCPAPRLYLDRPLPKLEHVLLERGYCAQIEVGLLDETLNATKLKTDLAVTLRPVLDAIEWQQKLELHSVTETGPDGHFTHPHEWVELERRKCETGVMQVYFICVGDEICGTVGAIEVNDLLRLKNLVVHLAWRRQGIAQAAVKALRNKAIRLNKQAFGCFALINGIGKRVYERVGLSIVTQQTEWYCNLNKRWT